MSRFDIKNLPLDGLKLIERQQMGDSRGFLSRIFCTNELSAAGWSAPVVQINHTHTARRGTVRGMHYQIPPHAEIKLVSCLQGEIWDVAVDLRTDSPTYLQWHAEILSAENRRALLIPEGFAHGFQTLSDNVSLLYCHSAAYHPDAEAGLSAQDPRLAIHWPQDITELSARDAGHNLIDPTFDGVKV
ncbi:dTDP-4-dehydrorhamnose 3,5-epimerase [Pseudohongiella acticola]|uniref:dTDP-4-dehydrorhamnose 3,5-epimerase n=1 Tax=Pseudohongiella acticola TaxID=1524254 RepID=A0A1E8CH16_9GAMM|nr:dTDP-4-dehydrorhamnose 3,5-epimerase [Pseudohongiella acticola]OFE11750.1 dTDP-4-dehydrorhamnose 3,5-epimerase [Pseudohongiella acticola]